MPHNTKKQLRPQESSDAAAPQRKKSRASKPSLSGYKGVTLNGNRWAATATKEGKQHHLGNFETKEEAAVAVQHFEDTGEEKPEWKGRRIRAVGMSGYKGVTLSGNRWKASAKKEGERHYLGSFVNPEEAAVAVQHFEDTGEKKPEWKGQGGKEVGMSGYKGVTLKGNRWRASAWKEGKQHHLGIFETKEEAAVAVQHFEDTGEEKPEWKGRRIRAVGMSGYKGVTLSGNRWKASAKKEGERHYLGSFVNPEEAAVAVQHFEDTGEKKPEWKGQGGKEVGMSGYKGVTLKGNRWAASAWKEGKQHYLGNFETKEEAAVAVQHFEDTGEEKPEWKGRWGKAVGMSGYKGVTLSGNRWAATATKEGKQHYLGSFVNPEEAAVAVQHFEDTGEKKPEWKGQGGKEVGMSGYKGVTLSGNRWRASVRKDGERHSLGTFETKEEAAVAVQHFTETGKKL